MKTTCLLLILTLLVLPCAALAESIAPVDGLPADFIFGADVSTVLSLEASGVVFRSADGSPADLFALLKDAGWTSVRARIWNDPFDAHGNGYGGGNNDVAAAEVIARRASAAGLTFVPDFHYSDFWADPGKQMCPKAWAGLDLEAKCNALYAFTCEALTRLKATGAQIPMVQIGNEINGGMAGESDLDARNRLLASGAKAVRDTLPEALIVVHYTNASQHDALKYVRELDAAGLDYDVFGLSYYSYWHGTLENLQALIRDARENFGKQVCIMETAYPFSAENFDMHINSVPSDSLPLPGLSREAQAADFRATVAAAHEAGAMGVYYWEPAWLPVPGATWEAQKLLWEAHGSGWASSYAAEYDPKDAGQWHGGSAWDSQALFNMDGTPAWTLSLPLMLRGR